MHILIHWSLAEQLSCAVLLPLKLGESCAPSKEHLIKGKLLWVKSLESVCSKAACDPAGRVSWPQKECQVSVLRVSGKAVPGWGLWKGT